MLCRITCDTPRYCEILFNFQLVNAKEVKVNKIWHSVPLPMPLQPHEPHEANGKKSKSMMLC